jgi:uncharacterized protein YprB with RNaseH-like and TPR domain
MPAPKTLFLDIETAPAKGYFWGHTHETDIIKVIRPAFMLSYAYQWQGKEKIHFKGLPDYPLYKSNLENDFFLLKDVAALLDEADIVIAHNGDNFDIKVIQGRFIRYSIKPPSPFKQVDTLKQCRNLFKIESNQLNLVAEYLGIGHKIPHTGLELWERWMAGDPQAWVIMKRYNKHDIYLLKEVFEVIKPFIKNYPNVNLWTGDHGCTVCGSKHIVKRGFGFKLTRKYQIWQCRDCGHYHTDTKAVK